MLDVHALTQMSVKISNIKSKLHIIYINMLPNSVLEQV